MHKKEHSIILIILLVLVGLFFHKTIRFGLVPFPADSLVSDFQPWRSTSYLGYDAGGIPNKAQYPDTIRQIYPWKTLVVESIKKGRLPLWNPYNFSGTPLLANFQSAALYPLGIFYLIFSQIDAWTILVILQPILATLFTYLYARKIGTAPLGSWLAALSFGFSGYMAVWLEYNTIGHVVLWLPLMLLAIEHIRIRQSARWYGILAFTHTASILAGHPQIYAYTAMFSIMYMFFRIPKKQWPFALSFTGLGIGVAGTAIIPGIELISHAARSPHDVTNLLTKILIQPVQLLGLPFPNFFGNPATRTYWPADTFIGKVTTIGLFPLFFFPSAFRRKDKLTRWFFWAWCITGILITNNPLTQLLYRLPIPLISASSPTLMTFLFSFSLAILCGFGLDFWMTDKHSIKKIFWRTLQLAGVFLFFILVSKLPIFPEYSAHFAVTLRALIYGGLISIAILVGFWVAVRFPKGRFLTICTLLAIHAIDLFMFFNRFNPFVPKALVFPSHPIFTFLQDKAPDRYWGYGTATIPANFSSQYHVFSPEGYDPLYPKWYGQSLYAYRTGKPLEIFDNATRSDAAISSSFGDGGLSDKNKQNVLNQFSVRYILDRIENNGDEKIFPPKIFKKVYTYEDWIVYENMQASPRISMDPGTAKILSYEPEQIVIRTESTASGTLTLTDTYYPGWKATIDDTDTTVKKSEWSTRELSIPKGTHTVIMSYKPRSVTYGAIASMTSIIGMIGGLLYIKRKKYHE